MNSKEILSNRLATLNRIIGQLSIIEGVDSTSLRKLIDMTEK